jgi:septum site-determining protein MinC
MAVVSKAKEPAVFDLKSAALTLIAVVLETTDLDALARALDERFAETPGVFDQDPVAIDLSRLPGDAGAIDYPALIALLRRHKMAPVAVKGGSAEQMQAALAHGLAEAADGPTGIATTPHRDAPEQRTERPEVVLTEVIHEVPVPTPPVATLVIEKPLRAGQHEVPVPTPPVATLVIEKPLRAGQQVYARGGDVVVLGVVNFGAEVIADGSIHVYAPLRGRAIAGARGNAAARIYAACMEPQLVAIAGTYRTAEVALPDNVRGKPAQVRLDGERLVIEPLEF